MRARRLYNFVENVYYIIATGDDPINNCPRNEITEDNAFIDGRPDPCIYHPQLSSITARNRNFKSLRFTDAFYKTATCHSILSAGC